MKYTIPELPLHKDVETKKVLKQTSDSNKKLGELKGLIRSMPNANILINTLVLQEAKDSSAIESIVTTQDELYKANLYYQQITSSAAKEVKTYASALTDGFEEVKKHGLLTNNTIIKIYQGIKINKAQFRSTPGTTLKNERTQKTVYEPPQTFDEIVNYMTNLEKFINNNTLSDLDPLIKLAIIHHQFESIHPFSDGNGRTGRIINSLYLVQQELLDIPVLYLSRYIISNKSRYYELLQKVRDEEKWEDWILFILKGIEITAVETIKLINDIKSQMKDFKQIIRINCPKIYNHDLLNNLFKYPYTKIDFIMKDLAVTRPTATSRLKQLTDLKLLTKMKLGRENYYINIKLFDLLMNEFHLELEETEAINSEG